jgi:hypothetical protein
MPARHQKDATKTAFADQGLDFKRSDLGQRGSLVQRDCYSMSSNRAILFFRDTA